MVPGQKLHKDTVGIKVNETLFKQMVGSLMYLTATRPDLMFAVSMISRFMSNPTELHYQAAKRVLRYIKGIMNYRILYTREGMEVLKGYTDSDYAGDVTDRKSTSGYVFMLSGGTVAWSSKKQPIVALSTTEAEYMAASSCACQVIWMRRVLKELEHIQIGGIVV